MTTWQLAQVNVGRLLAPLDSPQLAGFVAALEPVNALADAAPGFVWRLQDDTGDATSILPTDDPMLLINMSVWADRESLAAFVYGGSHLAVMRERRQWFAHLREAITALWWVPAGHRPTVPEAMARLALLRERGPSPHAFTFARHVPPPGAPDASAASDDDRWLCPA